MVVACRPALTVSIMAEIMTGGNMLHADVEASPSGRRMADMTRTKTTSAANDDEDFFDKEEASEPSETETTL